jgi:hypothetical protein
MSKRKNHPTLTVDDISYRLKQMINPVKRKTPQVVSVGTQTESEAIFTKEDVDKLLKSQELEFTQNYSPRNIPGYQPLKWVSYIS